MLWMTIEFKIGEKIRIIDYSLRPETSAILAQ